MVQGRRMVCEKGMVPVGRHGMGEELSAQVINDTKQEAQSSDWAQAWL